MINMIRAFPLALALALVVHAAPIAKQSKTLAPHEMWEEYPNVMGLERPVTPPSWRAFSWNAPTPSVSTASSSKDKILTWKEAEKAEPALALSTAGEIMVHSKYIEGLETRSAQPATHVMQRFWAQQVLNGTSYFTSFPKRNYRCPKSVGSELCISLTCACYPHLAAEMESSPTPTPTPRPNDIPNLKQPCDQSAGCGRRDQICCPTGDVGPNSKSYCMLKSECGVPSY